LRASGAKDLAVLADTAEDSLGHIVHDHAEGDAIEVLEGAGEALEHGAGALLAEGVQVGVPIVAEQNVPNLAGSG